MSEWRSDSERAAEQRLLAITEASQRDGDGHIGQAVDAAVARCQGTVEIEAIARHLVWLLEGKCREVRTLRRNILDECTTEIAARIVQD